MRKYVLHRNIKQNKQFITEVMLMLKLISNLKVFVNESLS